MAVVQNLEVRQGLQYNTVRAKRNRQIGTFCSLNEIQLLPPIKTKAKIQLPAKRANNGGVR